MLRKAGRSVKFRVSEAGPRNIADCRLPIADLEDRIPIGNQKSAIGNV
jgi:hypothetical protein